MLNLLTYYAFQAYKMKALQYDMLSCFLAQWLHSDRFQADLCANQGLFAYLCIAIL
jgi:hypothetical protein